MANIVQILSRAMCTNTASVKPPIQVFGLEGRYATALFSAASKSKHLEQVEKDLTSFRESLNKNQKLKELVISPIINRKVMSKTLKEIADQTRMASSTGNLLSLLADNGRLNILEGVISSFSNIMAAYRGEIICEVVTAKPLDAAQSKQLEGALRAFLKGNQSLKITARVDPSIIGGMIVSIGDRYVDMSIASKVKMYSDVITASA